MTARLVWAALERWPREQTETRAWSPFRRSMSDSYRREEIGWSTTKPELLRELDALGVDEAVIQLAVKDRDIRLDGQIRADAKMSHPGVIVSFLHPDQGPVTFACDRWTSWQANIRGVTKGLEALRLLDRYGITTSGEQYKGWKELPTGTAMGDGAEEPPLTRLDAARILAGAVSGAHDLAANTVLVLDDDDFRRYAYRAAVKLAHPDAGAPESEGFLRIQKAKETLDTGKV